MVRSLGQISITFQLKFNLQEFELTSDGGKMSRHHLNFYNSFIPRAICTLFMLVTKLFIILYILWAR